MTPIKTVELVAKVREIAAAHPNVKYPKNGHGGCDYDKPLCGSGFGCLIGQAIYAINPALRNLIASTPGLMGKRIGDLIEDSDDGIPDSFEVTDKAHVRWLSIVQSEQDRGQRWGRAIAEADERERQWIGSETH
jgi:hypothetical protein